ncbi:hypothetical protein [Acinetobacter sp. 102]|uniref:hypothetical protein n=1 Tax=Acinetobacter sp. 102 TaxID=3098766 RepID=UPI003FA53D60
MNSTLYLDLETYSETPIKNGTHIYAENAEIMVFAWALDDGPVHVWDVTDGSNMPVLLMKALLDSDKNIKIVAHNSGFDRTVLRHSNLKSNLANQAARDIHRWEDTMVQALSHSLPITNTPLSSTFLIMSVAVCGRAWAQAKHPLPSPLWTCLI